MYSMTGYAELKEQYNNYIVVMEMKSLNNKYLEPRFHLPHGFESIEYPLRKILKERISRGKIDIYFKIEAEKVVEEQRIKEMIRHYYNIIKETERLINANINFSINDIITLKSYLNPYENSEVFNEIPSEFILKNFEVLIEKLIEEKFIEGEATKKNIKNYIDEIGFSLEIIENRHPEVVDEYVNQLKEKIRELVNSQMDESRIMMEVGIYANKIDINEEVSRIKEHLRKMQSLLEEDKPVGRTLDFITQEINREANTIGSKVPDYTISREVVNIKASLEKIKEQVRNIE